MHFGVRLGALLRARLGEMVSSLLLCSCVLIALCSAALLEGNGAVAAAGASEEEAQLAAETALRSRMLEAEASVAALAASASVAAAHEAAPGGSGTPAPEPAVAGRAKGFTLLRKDASRVQPAAAEDAPVAGGEAEWLVAGPEGRGAAAAAGHCVAQLAARLGELRPEAFATAAAGSGGGPLEAGVAAAAEQRAPLGSFPAEAVAGTLLHFVARHGPLLGPGPARCARQLALAAEAADAEHRDLGLAFCLQALPEARQQLFWQLLRGLLLPLSQQPGWNAALVAAAWERPFFGGSDGGGGGGPAVLPLFLDGEQRVAAAAARHVEQFRAGGGAAVACATLPFVAELMLREEYRLVEPRILEVVLMTHTTHSRSAELLRLLLALYLRWRTPSRDPFRRLLRDRVLDAVGYWFMSPLYLRPDHLDEEYVAVWQDFLAGLIRAGIRDTEKTTFKKFTQLLNAHYSRLETQLADAAARQALAAAEAAAHPAELEALRPRLVLEAGEVRALAEALTRVDAAQFAQVRPFELFSNAHLDAARAPGFGRMTLQFNAVTAWVAHAVLAPESSSGERGALLGFFVALAKALCDLNNFHSSYAVLCGLNGSPVARLAKSFRKMPKKARATLEELMELNSHTKNYKRYREHLRGCRPPIVPQMGLISRDLFGLEENNADLVERRFVNLEKSRVLEKVAFDVLALQGTPFVFASAPEEPLVAFFRNLPAAVARLAVSEKDLYDRSLLLEPRLEQPADK